MADQTNDSNWLARLRAGEDKAWAEWFDVHGPRVWSYVARLIGADSATVADTVQEVFMSAARGLAAFDPGRGTLISWLLGIAHRSAALHWREHTRRADLLDAWSQQQLAALWAGTVDKSTDQAELSSAVRSVVAQLSEEMSALLVGRYLEERSTAELAADFGISEQAVRSRLTRARDRFREAFETHHREFVR